MNQFEKHEMKEQIYIDEFSVFTEDQLNSISNTFDYWSKEKKLEDSYICDCKLNYGKRCKYPDKYRTTGCDGKGGIIGN